IFCFRNSSVLGNTGSKILLGDIISDDETLRFITQDPRGRNAINYPHSLWPANTVPYIIDSSIEQQGIQAINDAISDYHKYTCVKFVARTTQRNYVRFFQGTGCSSSVGRTARGEQKVNLHRYCWTKGIVIHELAHAIGFFHEQSRSDRDSYVKILYENIEKGQENNFDKFAQGKILHLGEPYDYGSIMHYGTHAFSSNGKPTITTLQTGGAQIGQREALSANDIRQINKLYKCPTVYCNFDHGSRCDFTQDTQDDFDWTVHQGATPSGETGPSSDMSGKGWYIYAESSQPRVEGDRAVLLSPSLVGPYCLRMHFHMMGTDIGSLNVYKITASSRTTVLSTSGNKGDKWYMAQSSLTGSEQFKIAFEAVRGYSYRGDIALDEIKLAPGGCDTPATAAPSTTTQTVLPTTTSKPPVRSEVFCNFDAQSLCQFTQGSDDQFDWTLNKDSTQSVNTGPSKDISSAGYYVYAEASNPRQTGDRAHLVSPSLTGDFCVQFYYHMYGSSMGTLRVLRLRGSQRTIVGAFTGDRGNVWHLANIDLPAAQIQQYQVLFEAERNGWEGDMALDEIRLTPGRCRQFVVTTTLPTPPPTTKQPTPPVTQVYCNFDSRTWCGFTQDTQDEFDWTLHRGRTGSYPTTGPTNDFSGNGYYIYAEASSPRQPDDRARLVSPILTGSHCVVFRYHMNGADMGSLRVYGKVGSFEQQVWERSGDQADTWNGVEFRIDTTAQYQIVFEAVRGSGYMSDIALDEIKMIQGYCKSAQPVAPTTLLPSPPSTRKVAATTNGLNCPPGWSRYNSSCYRAFNSKSLWLVAKFRCRQNGGYLVAINNDKEHEFVRNLAATLYGDYAIWIGLRRDSTGKFSQWANGEPLTFTKWSRNEPDNFFGDEDCAEMFMYSGRWLDTTCVGRRASKHPFICEMSEFSPGRSLPPTTIPQASCGVRPLATTVKTPSSGFLSIGKIVGGKISSPGAWPWQAAIMCKTCQDQSCGGTLISPYHVVTAAHCVPTSIDAFIENYKVRLGEHNFKQTEGYEQDINITSVTKHGSYVAASYDRDIAVIKLASPARFNDRVAPVCLQSNTAEFPPGTECVITGWGRTSQGGKLSSVLKEAKVPIVSEGECRSNYGRDGLITSNMLCAGFSSQGTDACQGDSGGPLVCEKDNRWYLVGATSWGWGCAGQYYGVYTNIAKLYNWIKANTL
ncbi:unnamed protein product, partial [Porites evermanni]